MTGIEIETILKQCIMESADENGIAKLAEVGNRLREKGIDYKALGWLKLSMLLQEYPASISLWQDTSFTPPVAFTRWLRREEEQIGVEATPEQKIGEQLEAKAIPEPAGSYETHPIPDAQGIPEYPIKPMDVETTAIYDEPPEPLPAAPEKASADPEMAATTSPDPRPAQKRSAPQLAVHPGNELTRWAYLVHIPTMLEDLARLALPEVWDAPGRTEDSNAILLSYLKYTFVRLRREGKVCEDLDRGVAAFHTGLVDERYEPIYAMFEPNHNQTFSQKWKLNGFCIAGEDSTGKRLVASFNPLPEPATYFRSLHDMFYDIGAPEPIMDYEHILLENVDRLPKEFLLEYCTLDSTMADFIRKTPYELGMSADAYNSELARRIRTDMRYYRRLLGRFKEAVSIALRRVRWNYKTAIPMYYPVRNIMSLLLPLSLVEEGQADVALVVERLENGNYLGHTILTLQMAYNNARLVCRLESDWLRVDAGKFGVWSEL